MSAPHAAPLPGRLNLAEALLVGLGAAAVLIALAYAVLTRPGEETYWFSLLVCATVLVIPLFLAAFRSRLDALEPIYIICASYGLYFVYAPARDMLEGKEYFFGKHIPTLMGEAMAIAALGCIFLLLGYYAPLRRRPTNRMRSFQLNRRAAILCALAVGGSAALLFTAGIAVSGMTWIRFLTLGQMGSSADQALSLEAADSPFLGYLLAAADAFTPAFMMLFAFVNRRRWWLLLVLLPIAAVYTTIGFRYKLVILFLAPLVFRYLRSGRRPRPFSMLAAGVGAFLVIGIIGDQRVQIRAGERLDPEAISVAEAHEAFDRDVSLYQPFVALVSTYPESHDYLWGWSMIYVFVHPIPRTLWTDKPTPPIWEIIETSFNSREAVTAGVAYPNLGEYYANFGALGVAAGMFLFGVGARALYRYALRNRENEWAAIIYAIALPFLVQFVGRGYLVAMVQYLAFLFGPVLLVMVLLRKREARGARQPRRVAAPAVASFEPRSP